MSIAPIPLVYSTRNKRIRTADLRRDGLVPVGFGAYLPKSAIRPESKPWEVRGTVTAARASAACFTPDGAQRAALTGEAALMLHGIPTWHSAPAIHVRVGAKGNGERLLLPTVRVDGLVAPQAELVRHRVQGGPPPGPGISVDIVTAAVDSARFEHPLVAWVGMCGALARLSRFHAFKQVDSRRREAAIKKQLMEQADQLRGRPGHRRVEAIIRGADAGVEGPGEGALHWLVSAILREDQREAAAIRTQWPVGGQRYFIDLAIPGLKLDLEFDGVEKTRDYAQGKRWIDRQNWLLREGWTQLRHSTPELMYPEALGRKLAAELGSNGLRVLPPGGPAWEPVPAPMLSPEVRH